MSTRIESQYNTYQDSPLTERQIDRLLSDLHDMAKSVDTYEYGLPIYDRADKESLRSIVRTWFSGIMAETDLASRSQKEKA